MNRQYFNTYYNLERSHWWFKARLEILESLLDLYLVKEKKNIKILNTGVATGATTKMLEKYGNVTSLEYDQECCNFLKNELNIDVINGSLTQLPFKKESFDLVCAFDVIEHIKQDDLAIDEIKRVLKKNGTFCLTVPAFNFLWSEHDIINHHFRRYTSSKLAKKITNRGMTVSYKTYFNFFLFTPILIIRFFASKMKKKSGKSDFETYKQNSFLSNILFNIFRFEKWFIKQKKSFPFGVSIIITGIKKHE